MRIRAKWYWPDSISYLHTDYSFSYSLSTSTLGLYYIHHSKPKMDIWRCYPCIILKLKKKNVSFVSVNSFKNVEKYILAYSFLLL